MQAASRTECQAPENTYYFSGLRSWRLAALAGLLLLLLLVLTTFRDYGVSWDERVQNEYGQQILAYYESGFVDRTAVTPDDEADDGNLPYYGGSFDLALALINRFSPFDTYQTRHLFGGLVGLIGLFAAMRLGERLRGPRAGFLAAGLLATIPAYYGHMFINPKDLPFAAAMAVLLVAICAVLEEWPRPRWPTVVTFGIAAGIALGTRVGAAFAVFDLLVPLTFWLGAVLWCAGWRSTLKGAAGGCARLLAVLPLTWATMALLWPWAAQAPLNPIHALLMFSHFPFPADILFEGTVVPASEVPRSYLPVFLALTLPESMLLGLLAASLAAVAAIARWRHVLPVPTAARLQFLAVTTAALFPIAYFVVAKPTAYNGMRHFLFILPPLAVLAAVAIDDVWSSIQGLQRHVLFTAGTAFIALAIVRMIQLHPYEYIYFNDLFGGLPAASGRFELDYWGVSVAETVRSLAGKVAADGNGTPPRPWRLALDAESTSAKPFLPPFMALTDDWNAADYRLNLCPCDPAPPGAHVVAETRRMGVLLSQVFDARSSTAVAAALPPPAPLGGGEKPGFRGDRAHLGRVVTVQRLAEERRVDHRRQYRPQMKVQTAPVRAHVVGPVGLTVGLSGEREHRADRADIQVARQHAPRSRSEAPSQRSSGSVGGHQQQAG